MQNTYYSFTRLAGLSGNLEAYKSMLKKTLDKNGNCDKERYRDSRRQLEKWIVRGIGDALKFGNQKAGIVQHFIPIVRIFNHYPKPDDSEEYINNTIKVIKREARYHPYGIRWINITPDKVARWVDWRQSFTKDSDWRLFCAIDLFSDINVGKGWIPIYTPSNLDRTAAMDRETRKRGLERLIKANWITCERNPPDQGIRIKVLNRLGTTGAGLLMKVPRPENTVLSTSDYPDLWYRIHRLIAGRPPMTRPHPDFPLIYTDDSHLHLRLGTVSVRQLVAAIYSKEKLDRGWKRLRKDSCSFRLHEKALKEVLDVPRKMPYPVDDDIENNRHFHMLLDYQEKAAFPAMDRGLPFDVHTAKKLRFQLFMAYYGMDPDPLNTKKGKRSIKSRLGYVNQYISNAAQWEDHRLRPSWDVRGTISDRTVLRRPAIQSMPKDLRFLLQNEEETLEWHDIKGQEIYITIMESNSKQGKAIIRQNRDLMQEIACSLGIDKKLVKKIIHPRLKGKGLGKLRQEHGADTVKEVLQAFRKIVPEAQERKAQLETFVRTNHGELPATPLGRTPVTIDQERVSTCASAIMDQSIGAELTKQWAIHYSQTEEGKKWPIVLDMHDAIVLLTPQAEEQTDENRRGAATTKALERATDDLRYDTNPTAEPKTEATGNTETKPKQQPSPRAHNTYWGNLGGFELTNRLSSAPSRVLIPP